MSEMIFFGKYAYAVVLKRHIQRKEKEEHFSPQAVFIRQTQYSTVKLSCQDTFLLGHFLLLRYGFFPFLLFCSLKTRFDSHENTEKATRLFVKRVAKYVCSFLREQERNPKP